MPFRFVPPLSDADRQSLMVTYTYGEKPALRRRAHAIVLSHQGHTIDQTGHDLSVTRGNGLAPVRCPGGTGPRRTPGQASHLVAPPSTAKSERERLLELVQEQPHQLKAVQARFQQETGKGACTMTIKRALKKSGL